MLATALAGLLCLDEFQERPIKALGKLADRVLAGKFHVGELALTLFDPAPVHHAALPHELIAGDAAVGNVQLVVLVDVHAATVPEVNDSNGSRNLGKVLFDKLRVGRKVEACIEPRTRRHVVVGQRVVTTVGPEAPVGIKLLLGDEGQDIKRRDVSNVLVVNPIHEEHV